MLWVIMDKISKIVLSTSSSKCIDIIRIIATWFVLLGHCFSQYGFTLFRDEEKFFYLQNFAVIIFFSLAGFLMIYSLDRRNLTWGNYVFHQAIRIYQFYIPALILISLIDLGAIITNPKVYNYYNSYNLKVFVENWLMMQSIINIDTAKRFGSGLPLWTMSIEWWYFITFSFLYIKWCKERKRDYFTIICGILVTLILIGILRFGLAVSFFIGMMMFIILKKNIIKPKSVWLLISVFSFLTITSMGIICKQAYILPVFILTPIAIGALVIYQEKSSTSCRTSKMLRFISNSTFSLYLIHYSVLNFSLGLNIGDKLKLCFTIVISNAIALLITWLVNYKLKVGKKVNDIIYNLWTCRIKRNKK